MGEEEKDRLRNKYGITAEDEAPYVMPKEEDYHILAKCKELETRNLSSEDAEMVSFIHTQLFDDWRAPILEKTQQLLERYR